MLPALKPGRIVIAWGRSGNILPGDVVIIRHGGLEKIKRVMLVNANDKRLFVMGDNQEHSTDSRTFGWLHKSAVQGRVIWPRSIYRIQKEPQE